MLLQPDAGEPVGEAWAVSLGALSGTATSGLHSQNRSNIPFFWLILYLLKFWLLLYLFQSVVEIPNQITTFDQTQCVFLVFAFKLHIVSYF